MKLKKIVWPTIGGLAVIFSLWLLYKELRGVSFREFASSLGDISPTGWLLSGLCTLAAYAALAGYDHIALLHLKRRVPWLFITLASFTTYALSHNIGASVFSGAVVRYRAYTSQGLSGGEVGVLVALCSFTFALGTILLTGIVLVLEPRLGDRFLDLVPDHLTQGTGYILLGLVALYVIGSWLGLRPLKIGSFELTYPRLPIVARQLIIAPLELLAAAGILYFALPAEGNPGFLIVLGIFLVSFSIALLSHAPGGVGVLELVFIMGLPDMDPAAVLAALVVFLFFYLIIPFVIALGIILVYERRRLSEPD